MEQQSDILKIFLNRLSASVKACFAAGMAAGVMTHLYMLTNKLPNWDDLTNIDAYGASEALGRWLIPFIHKFFSQFSAPALNGGMGILLYVCAACVITQALEIRSMTGGALIGILMITFPSIASNLTYMYLGGVYGVAVLMASLAVYVTRRFRYGIIAGGILIYLVLGIYQAYMPFAAALLLLGLAGDIFTEKGTKQIVRTGMFYLGMLLAATAAYLVKCRQFELNAYRGIDEVGNFEPGHLPVLIARAYHRILQYYVTAPPSYILPFGRKIHILLILLTAAGGILLVKKHGICKKPGRMVLLLGILFLIPLAASAVYVMAPAVQNASTVMIFAYVTVCFLPVLLLERLTEGKWQQGIAGGLVLLLLLCAFCNYRVTNEAYFRTSLAFERIENYYNRIMARLEGEPGYRYGEKMAVVGDSWPDPHVLSSFSMGGETFRDMEGIAVESGLFTSGTRLDFLRTYLGIDSPYISQEEYDEILHSQTFRELSIFPEENCTAKINGIWVIKVEN